MQNEQGQGRHAIALGTLLACILLAWCPCAFALDPALDVSQYAHTAWRVRDGFFKGGINSIAQTPDGYIWLGTDFGLLRFDGVRTVQWQPPTDQQLPSNNVRSVLATRDGTLWIGTIKGLASWQGGKLTSRAELAGQVVGTLLEDREGAVWAGAIGIPTGRLCSFQKGNVRCFGEDGGLGIGVLGLYEDRKGNLWVGVRDGLWRWKPGPAKFYPLPGEPNGIQGLAEGDDGTLLISMSGGLRRFVDGKAALAYPFPANMRQFQALNLFRDREGGLWIGTSGGGLVHVHEGRTDVFAQPDGLSGNDVSTLFEDQEGNMWVATENGLDRFRGSAVVTFAQNQGLSNPEVNSVIAARDGTVWASAFGGRLYRWSQGQIAIYGERSASGSQSTVPGVQSLLQDDHGRIWMSSSSGVGYLEDGRYIVSPVPGGVVHSITQDTIGNLWIAHQDLGLFRLSPANQVQQIPWSMLGHQDHATALVADGSQGGLWLGFYGGGIVYFADGRVQASYAAADGLSDGRVDHLRLDRDRTLWAATDSGLSQLKNGRFATLTSKNGLPCDAVHWLMEDDANSFWLGMACGLVRIARPDMDVLADAVLRDKDANRTIRVTVFDSSDGIRSTASATGYSPQVAKSADGKLWFATAFGVGVVDPRHLPFNNIPPPVHIEQIIADRKTYDATSDSNGYLRLPSRIRDLEIDYTALSFVAHERVLFRYKLENHDRDWQDVGTRRQAFYNDLPPGNYRFRVSASNNSGVWNEAGTFLDFAVAPAYYQTTWFRLSIAAAFLLLLGVVYQQRLRQVARQFEVRMEERVNERTRIARDLHDTLLQSFQAVLMKFHMLNYLIQENPEAQKTLETIVEQARGAITEGRNAVQGLRSSTVVTNDLARAMSTLAEELAAAHAGQDCPEFRMDVEGTSRDLAPIVRDDVHRIACEALRNAFRHAQARRIEVEIRYDRRQLRLLVRDNGKGMDPNVLGGGGRPGHFGLAGMHERARLVGGNLAVRSKLDSGTEAELTIPASVAYVKSPVASRSMSSGKT